jgi:hypothetical protein
VINTVTCWRAACDGCGDVKQYEKGDALFYSLDETQKALSAEDWEVADSDLVLCPACVCRRDGHPLTAIRHGQCVACDALVPDAQDTP